jgi:hypothetical protein
MFVLFSAALFFDFGGISVLLTPKFSSSLLFPESVAGIFSLFGSFLRIDTEVCSSPHLRQQTREKRESHPFESLPFFDFARRHRFTPPENLRGCGWGDVSGSVGTRPLYFFSDDNPDVDWIEISRNDSFLAILVRIAMKTFCYGRNERSDSVLPAHGRPKCTGRFRL